MSLHMIVPLTFLWWLESLLCSRFFEVPCVVWVHVLVQRCFEGHECSLSRACCHLFCVRHIFTSPSLALPVALLQEPEEISF